MFRDQTVSTTLTGSSRRHTCPRRRSFLALDRFSCKSPDSPVRLQGRLTCICRNFVKRQRPIARRPRECLVAKARPLSTHIYVCVWPPVSFGQDTARPARHAGQRSSRRENFCPLRGAVHSQRCDIDSGRSSALHASSVTGARSAVHGWSLERQVVCRRPARKGPQPFECRPRPLPRMSRGSRRALHAVTVFATVCRLSL